MKLGDVVIFFSQILLYIGMNQRIKINDFSTDSACQNHDFQSIQLLSSAIGPCSFISQWGLKIKKIVHSILNMCKINVLWIYFSFLKNLKRVDFGSETSQKTAPFSDFILLLMV